MGAGGAAQKDTGSDDDEENDKEQVVYQERKQWCASKKGWEWKHNPKGHMVCRPIGADFGKETFEKR